MCIRDRLAQHDVRAQIGFGFVLDDLAQMIVELHDRRHVDDVHVELALELFAIARPHARKQRDVATLGHDGQDIRQDRVAVREDAARERDVYKRQVKAHPAKITDLVQAVVIKPTVKSIGCSNVRDITRNIAIERAVRHFHTHQRLVGSLLVRRNAAAPVSYTHLRPACRCGGNRPRRKARLDRPSFFSEPKQAANCAFGSYRDIGIRPRNVLRFACKTAHVAATRHHADVPHGGTFDRLRRSR